jgi:hypothetical protein
MNGKSIEIGGKVFDLTNPEEKKAAIRAWLKAKAAQKTPGQNDASPLDIKAAPQIPPEDPSAPRH